MNNQDNFEDQIDTIILKHPNAKRESLKRKLKEKKLVPVISTVVWKEGVNIPTIDVIVNASGGKDDLPIIQLIGRGLRLTLIKKIMTLLDFFDNSNFHLVKHFGNRISLYCEREWL